MIKIGEFKYVGPCDCGRTEMLVGTGGKTRTLCDGKRYYVTPTEINGHAFPSDAKPYFWCRNKHFKTEAAKTMYD
jgi:hypothetical protein